jgi:hypothetical protein
VNETQINAQFNMLVEQRNAALNSVVNMAGELAVLKEKVLGLEKQLEAATALVADSATVA